MTKLELMIKHSSQNLAKIPLISVLCLSLLAISCATTAPQSPSSPTTSSAVNNPAIPQNNKQVEPAQPLDKSGQSAKPGGYYLDDGPGENPPQNIDQIPNATPKTEALLTRANKPYVALGTTYTPMTAYKPYTASGVASWYGKRYHGRKTSSGEVYDMYGMTAAHPTLPLPSYVKVTNPANGRNVIVRVNDRGPFKKDRLIDLSYAAAYKLRFTTNGSTIVDVQAIDASNFVKDARNETSANLQSSKTIEPLIESSPSSTMTKPSIDDSTVKVAKQSNATIGYFVQAGAFKNAVNADALMRKIQDLDLTQNAVINSVYNNGLHRVKLGPFDNKEQADLVASQIRQQLNTSVMTILQ